jgi:organic hydroperoxide reductase OsmC/OhrA
VNGSSHDNPHHWHATMLAVSVAACVMIVFGSMAATVHYVNRENEVRRQENIATCVRGNHVRFAINAIVAHLGLDLPVLPILDCPNVIH